MRSLLLLFLIPSAAYPELFVWGLKGGVPMTDAFSTPTFRLPGSNDPNYSSATRRYTIGPTAELRLPFGLGVELDLLYKRLGYESTTSNEVARTTGNSWEFPLLVKYRAPGILWRPYAAMGFSFRSLSGLKQFTSRVVSGRDPEELRRDSSKGFVLGGGIEFHAPFLTISPELRYTRWGSEPILSSGEQLRSARNQAEFLLGITF